MFHANSFHDRASCRSVGKSANEGGELRRAGVDRPHNVEAGTDVASNVGIGDAGRAMAGGNGILRAKSSVNLVNARTHFLETISRGPRSNAMPRQPTLVGVRLE